MAAAELVVAGGLMAGLGGFLSVLLAAANQKLRVEEDPRIDEVEAMLPKANCGACGLAGCRAFAEAAVSGAVAPGRCTVNSPDRVAAMANLLGVDAGTEEKRVARVACAGGSHVAVYRARYQGLNRCRAAALVSGGGKGCAWGCLGLGDCVDVCEFGALALNEYRLPVVNEAKCTACGACVEVCPKGLISLHPVSHRLWVACSSELRGTEAEAVCQVACTGCGRCAADAPEGLVTVVNHLARVDYSRNDEATPEAVRRCVTGALVWLEEGQTIKGAAAKKVLRKTPLPVGCAPSLHEL